jgi:hypothetical protein
MRRFPPVRESFIPKGSIKLTPKGVEAEVYIYESAGRPCALIFVGKQNKPIRHAQYRSAERREQDVRDYIENRRKVEAYKAEQASKRHSFQHSYKVGDVLHYSWGYEQTNCEFYEVISATPGTAGMLEIAQDAVPDSQQAHGMAESRVARPGVFLEKSEPITKRVQYSESGPVTSAWPTAAVRCGTDARSIAVGTHEVRDANRSRARAPSTKTERAPQPHQRFTDGGDTQMPAKSKSGVDDSARASPNASDSSTCRTQPPTSHHSAKFRADSTGSPKSQTSKTHAGGISRSATCSTPKQSRSASGM